jgi:serine/threonine protein kinase
MSYKNKDATPDGMLSMGFRSGAPVKLKAKGKGANLVMPFPELVPPVVVRMVRSDGPQCWEARYSRPIADLATLLKRSRQAQKRMPLAPALRMMTAVAGALAYAHEKRGRDSQPLGIIHRDVTPSNILVSRDGATKLIDFGIARAARAARPTRRGSIIGKLHYLSPEQVRDGPVDARADLWSFGVVLFQILTGTRPFTGQTPETWKAIW